MLLILAFQPSARRWRAVNGAMIARARRAGRLYLRSPYLIIIALPLLPFEAANWMVPLDYWILTLPPRFIVTSVVVAAMIWASGSIILGERAHVLPSFAAAFANFGNVLVVDLALFAAVLLLFTVIALPVGVYLFVRWWFATQAVMLLDKPSAQALSFSSSIVRGSWWWTAGQLTALLMVGAIAWVLIALVSAQLGDASRGLLTYAWTALALPYATIFQTILFYERLERAEQVAPTPILV